MIIIEPDQRGHRCDLPWRGLVWTGYPDGTLAYCRECGARFIARTDYVGAQTWCRLRWWNRAAHQRIDEALQ